MTSNFERVTTGHNPRGKAAMEPGTGQETGFGLLCSLWDRLQYQGHRPRPAAPAAAGMGLQVPGSVHRYLKTWRPGTTLGFTVWFIARDGRRAGTETQIISHPQTAATKFIRNLNVSHIFKMLGKNNIFVPCFSF